MKNLCDGCPKQKTCRFGKSGYDSIEKRNFSLWERFLLVSFDQDFDQSDHPEQINDYLKKLSELKRPSKDDRPWLLELLDYSKRQIQAYLDFGKCGSAYVRYMGLNRQTELIKEKLNFIK